MADQWELEAKAVSKRKGSAGAKGEGRKFTPPQQVKPGEGKGGEGNEIKQLDL